MTMTVTSFPSSRRFSLADAVLAGVPEVPKNVVNDIYKWAVAKYAQVKQDDPFLETLPKI